MKILITNDDGIFAKGIYALAQVAKEFGEVTLVAPNQPRSAQGHAITIEHPLRLNPFDFMEGIDAYECSGTPVDCVKLAKHVVMKGQKFDLCFSGINHGANDSINVLYSGTMSAAMEAAIEGIPSIGFSLTNYRHNPDFTAAQDVIRKIIRFFIDNQPLTTNLLNINIPSLPLAEIKGIKVCHQAEGYWREEFIEMNDPMGKPYYWLSGKFTCVDTDENADHVALSNGFVAVVPVMHDLTHYSSIAPLKKMEDLLV